MATPRRQDTAIRSAGLLLLLLLFLLLLLLLLCFFCFFWFLEGDSP
jgi:hypothetical protein